MTLTFRIQLRHIKKPPVWRKVVIPGSFTFAKLHETIQEAFGWTYSHLYQFQHHPYDGGWTVKDPNAIETEKDSWIGKRDDESYNAEKTVIAKFLHDKGLDKFVYVYDFGDDWIHDITLEATDEKEELIHPVCLAGKGACPPEDCGGPWGYEDIKQLFAEHPDSDEARSYKEWMFMDEEDEFDPKYFDIDEVNEALMDVQMGKDIHS